MRYNEILLIFKVINKMKKNKLESKYFLIKLINLKKNKVQLYRSMFIFIIKII